VLKQPALILLASNVNVLPILREEEDVDEPPKVIWSMLVLDQMQVDVEAPTKSNS